MLPVPTTESGTHRAFTKQAGSESLPGYKLLSPLGRGGFGEVWRCEAPGGLHKAIKFVTSEAEDGRGEERFAQELAAFEQIKTIRHPFLLTLERVEQLGGELIMVMELADRQLQDRFRDCRAFGLPGIPRDELLAYFADAAEALDVISAKFGLQHLDVKPANLFLVSGHVKVGDYGLVARLEGPDAGNRGLTPRYVAPEVLHGAPSSHSDQYSLALVYQELLTGEFPYAGRTPQQLMLQHVSAQPNISCLPPADRAAVAVALAKRPDDRFPSCLAFVQALMAAESPTALPSPAMNVRRSRVDRSVAEMNLGAAGEYPEDTSGENNHSTHGSGRSHPSASAPSLTQSGKQHSTVTGPQKAPPPEQVPAAGAPAGPRRSARVPVAPPRPAVAEPPVDEVEAGLVVLDRIRSVVPVGVLLGMACDELPLNAQSVAEAVVTAAAGGYVPHVPGDVVLLANGGCVSRFPSTVPASVVPLKLSVLRELYGVSLEQPDPARIVLRRVGGGGGLFGIKKFGYEVTVTLPTAGSGVGEVTATGRLFGTPGQRFAREVLHLMPKLLAEVRNQLGNVQDRRKSPRVAFTGPVILYPVHSDGGIDAAVTATCRDVSAGGLGFATAAPLPTKYVYATFPQAPATAGQAILARLVRVTRTPTESVYGAQYRTDL
jgi:serine/threonine protein kinase